ncbi:MAG: hypothetical protein N3D75_02585 [Candidatus Aenigmarchaeota archaeon]|nr:hypothetical protein [Candidatus Aenigmarchaeota archaeon]
MVEIEEIEKVSQIFASPKRLMLLHFLTNEPMGYGSIRRKFREIEIPFNSSEIYKSLKVLVDSGCVIKKETKYVITARGMKAVELSRQVLNEEPKEPRMRMEF